MRSTLTRHSDDLFRLLALIGLIAAWVWAVMELGPKSPQGRPLEVTPAFDLHLPAIDEGEEAI